jgi:hypothetical protein
MEPAVRRTYERLLHAEMDARLSFDTARDIMDRTYGKPMQPTSTASQIQVDHRHMHLSAVQAFNEPLSAGTVGQHQHQLEHEQQVIDTIITTPSIYDQPDDGGNDTPDFLL